MSPSSDVRSYRGRGGGGGGGSSYDDQGRGWSKTMWEWFSNNYENQSFSRSFLFSIDDDKCYDIFRANTDRFGLSDFPYVYDGNVDSRCRRLVLKHESKDTYADFYKYILEGYRRYKAKKEAENKEASRLYEISRSREYEAQQANAARIERQDEEYISKMSENVSGMIKSDMESAFVIHDKVGDAGDWLEEVVPTFIDGTGFGYEESKAVGVKLQVTVSLDLSNSMHHNGIDKDAANAFRDISFALMNLKSEYPQDLFVGFFEFSLNNGDSELGKRARVVESGDWGGREKKWKGFERYIPSEVNKGWGYYNSPFTGEDTWIHPLFERIEQWENLSSDPGCVRLDIIITDAVLEHPTDIRKADAIQERRDGSLQTVFLNFIPEEEWLGSTLPKRCFEMPVTSETVSGILRNVLSEFVAVQI